MNTFNSKSWQDLKGKLKAKYTELTDEDLFYTENNEAATMERIEKKLGKTGDELKDILTALTLRPTGHQS